MRHRILFFFLAFIGISQFVTSSDVRNKYNFNSDWLLNVGDVPEAKQPRFSDSEWKKVTLPHAFNEDEAFRLSIDELTDTIMWYRKHFRLPADSKNKKVFVEFEGVRQGADFYINGQNVGLHENGVMAVGFDLTPYIKYGQENVIAVRIDNDWNYKERATGTKYQWSNKNFNTRVRDNILKSKEQKNIQPTKGGHKMVTCQNYVSLFYRQITSCPSDGGIS